MTVNKTINGSEVMIAIEGRLDTNTSKDLETEMKECLPGCTNLVIDMEKLVYISSAGLRVLLGAQKTMNRQGQMVIRNVNDDVMEIFEVTGFVDILSIE